MVGRSDSDLEGQVGQVGIIYEDYGWLLVRTWRRTEIDVLQPGFYVDATGPDHIYGYSQPDGYFGWFQARVGSYNITCSDPDFEQQTKTGVLVSKDQDTIVDFYMVPVSVIPPSPEKSWISFSRAEPTERFIAGLNGYLGASLDYTKQTGEDVILEFRPYVVYKDQEYFRNTDIFQCRSTLQGAAGVVTGSCNPEVQVPPAWFTAEETEMDIGLDMKINGIVFPDVFYWPQVFAVGVLPETGWIELNSITISV